MLLNSFKPLFCNVFTYKKDKIILPNRKEYVKVLQRDAPEIRGAFYCLSAHCSGFTARNVSFFYCSSCDVLDPTVQVRNIDIVVEQSTTMSPHKWFLFLCPWGCFGFSFRQFLWLLFFFQESSPNKQRKQKAVEQTERLIKFDGSGWEYKC